MKRSIIFLLTVLMVVALTAGCAEQTAQTSPSASSAVASQSVAPQSADAPESSEPADGKKQVYVWACQYNSLPLFVNNDYVGLDLAAEELGVEVKKVGPQNIDLPAFIAAIEQEIPNKPDGLMVVCWDNALTDPVNKAVAAGIPVATVDGDLPESGRILQCGTNWYNLGVLAAQELQQYIGDKSGKIVQIGIPGNFFQQESNRGFAETIKTVCPNVEFVKEFYASNMNSQDVTKTIGNLISSMPDLIGVFGSDSSSGPGIGQAIKEANKIDKIFAVCIDAEPEHIKCVQEGTLKAAFGQKRLLFTYYGLKMLYDYNNSRLQFTNDDRGLGITNIPSAIDTGFIIVTPKNVEQYLAATADKAK